MTDLLECQDGKIVNKVSKFNNHPFCRRQPRSTKIKYSFKSKSSERPKINTSRFMNTFLNEIII